MCEKNHLLINEIFQSVSGEVGYFNQGEIITFIRFAGCNLGCIWCDTARAQEPESGSAMSIEDIISHIYESGFNKSHKIHITGGEPLMQSGFYDLCMRLAAEGFYIQVETNGSYLPSRSAGVLSYIFDVKLPSSGAWEFMVPVKALATFICKYPNCWIKYPIANETDFEVAQRHLKKLETIIIHSSKGHLPSFNIRFPGQNLQNVAFSPIGPHMTAKTLYHLMIEAELYHTINVQLHKLLDMQ
jgi:7-carboxy-7-deazaguanine synthase